MDGKKQNAMDEQATEKGLDEVVEAPQLSGRAGFIERYKSRHPDLTDEPDDDSLFDFAGKTWDERDGIQEKYDALNGANEKLAAVVQEDPRFAQLIAMVASGESPLYAIGKCFGSIIDELDEERLEELRRGQDDFKKQYDEMRNNFKTYEATLKSYVEKNGLSEEDAEKINNAILDIAEALNHGDIPEEVIDNVWKGMDYENEKTAELEAAKLAGKNEAIEAVKGKKTTTPALPDLAARKTNKLPPIVDSEPKRIRLADAIIDRE